MSHNSEVWFQPFKKSTNGLTVKGILYQRKKKKFEFAIYYVNINIQTLYIFIHHPVSSVTKRSNITFYLHFFEFLFDMWD